MVINYDVLTHFNSHKTVTIFTSTILKDSKNLKEVEIMYHNETYICIS